MNSTDERAAFLAAIRAEPDDDTPRLVFADWLQEHGDEVRAEFIRVQCAIARLPGEEQCGQCRTAHFGRQRTSGPCRCSPRLRDLRRREYELWQGELPTAEWGLPVPEGKWSWHVTPRRDSQAGPPVAHLERGFIESVRCPAADWIASACAILAEHPVRRVTLTTDPVFAGQAYGIVWLVGDPERKAIPLSAVDEIACAADLHERAKAVLSLRWPGVEFTLPTSEAPDEA